MKNSKVARMGSNNSKYGSYSVEFNKGDAVVINLPEGETYTGIVMKDTGMMVIVNVDGISCQFKSIFVKLAE